MDVRVNSLVRVVRNCTNHGFKIGEIAQIVEVCDSYVAAKHLDRKNRRVWHLLDEEFVPLTDEEIEAYGLEHHIRDTVSWEKIRRKPGEIRRGDIVRTLDNVFGFPVGTIGIAENNTNNTSFVRVRAINPHTGEYERKWHTVELVAPVESVVNLRVEED